MFESISWLLMLFVMTILPLVIFKIFPKIEINIKEVFLVTFLCFTCTFLIFQLGISMKVSDTQVLSGQIIKKERKHDSRLSSESCNCDKDGCSVCVYTIYSVEWNAIADIGKIKIHEKESRSSLVYMSSDPERYKSIVIGEPAAIESSYVNYVAGSPDSLFATRRVSESHKNLIKPYPKVVYDFYRADRVVLIGNIKQDKVQWNNLISDYQKEWGVKRKGNVMLVFTDTDDMMFALSLKNHWLQGKQNDLIVLIGVDKNDNSKIIWNDVISWTRSEIMKLELKDSLQKLGSVADKEAVMKTINNHMKDFSYRDIEKDFDYLKDDVKPNDVWLYLNPFICMLVSFFGVVFYRYYVEKYFSNRRGFRY